jgi:hypothetical protein
MGAVSLKIMIVDDEPPMRNVLRIGLGSYGDAALNQLEPSLIS